MIDRAASLNESSSASRPAAVALPKRAIRRDWLTERVQIRQVILRRIRGVGNDLNEPRLAVDLPPLPACMQALNVACGE